MGMHPFFLCTCASLLLTHAPPHTTHHNAQTAVRVVLTIGVSGLLLALLQPPLPRIGGAACPQLPFALCPRLWDERHVPMHGADDVAVWGSGLGRREHWPRWLLVSAAGLGLVGLSGVVPGSRSPLVRLCVGGGVGWLVGNYLALELVPEQAMLQVRCQAAAAGCGWRRGCTGCGRQSNIHVQSPAALPLTLPCPHSITTTTS
jgi:hypothetical protein